jgi:hypothetical protein
VREEWSLSPFPHSLDVDWEEEGDEWTDYVYELLRARVDLSRWSTSHDPETGGRDLTATTRDGRELPRVRLTREKDGMGIRVVGAGELDGRDIELWTEVIREATAMAGRSHQQFEWTAALGVGGVVTPGVELTKRCRVGPVWLEPFGRGLAEHWDSPSLTRAWTSYSFPVKVKGASIGYKWEVAAQAAIGDLHRLVCLLSIAWGEPWTLRERPRNDDSITLPATSEWVPPNGIPVEVPAWCDGAWTMLDEDEALMHATHAYHQGALAHLRHPSLALLAFVAAIEAIGARYVNLERCDRCGSRIGSRKRFLRAASLVISEDEALALRKLAYDEARSKTAHEGRLHGLEISFGFPPPRYFKPDPSGTFNLVAVRSTKEVAEKLLQRAFRGDLP